jgi:N-acylneuraminate cytidylyltransferase
MYKFVIVELKKFNTKDGKGFQLLREHGYLTGIITGEDVRLVKRRAEKLKVDILYMGVANKIEILHRICEEYHLKMDEIAYIGDDINDLEVVKAVGLGCTVHNGMECLKEVAGYITKSKGGEGAVREIVELLLNS